MKIPVENKTAVPMYIGSYMVPPGETRHFEEHDVPMHLRPASAAAAAPEAQSADPVAELAIKGVKAIAAAIPDMSDEDLQALELIEESKGDEARKTVLEAIAAEQLKRAEEGKGE